MHAFRADLCGEGVPAIAQQLQGNTGTGQLRESDRDRVNASIDERMGWALGDGGDEGFGDHGRHVSLGEAALCHHTTTHTTAVRPERVLRRNVHI